jgi:hypothetical protein
VASTKREEKGATTSTLALLTYKRKINARGILESSAACSIVVYSGGLFRCRVLHLARPIGFLTVSPSWTGSQLSSDAFKATQLAVCLLLASFQQVRLCQTQHKGHMRACMYFPVTELLVKIRHMTRDFLVKVSNKRSAS